MIVDADVDGEELYYLVFQVHWFLVACLLSSLGAFFLFSLFGIGVRIPYVFLIGVGI